MEFFGRVAEQSTSERDGVARAEEFLRAAFSRVKSGLDGDLGMSAGEAGALVREWTDVGGSGEEKVFLEKRREVFLAAVCLYESFPDGADAVVSMAGQEPALLSAREWADLVADTEWRAEKSPHLKERLREVFGLAFASQNMSAEMARELDFDHPAEYFRTSAFLEFLGRFFNGAVRTGFLDRRGKDEELKRLFDAVIAENKGSYFLNARARVLWEQMEGGERPVGLDGDRGVFALAPGIEGKFENGALLERKMEDLSELMFLVDHHPASRTQRPSIGGESDPEFLFDGGRTRVLRDGRAFSAQEGFHPVSYEGFVGTEEERQKTVFEYGALVAKPMRELIERDLGVNITELSKEEQIFFLQFVKNIEASEVDGVRDFCLAFGRDGLRAFLSLEHGGEKMGNVILAIPGRYGEADAQKIFAKYGEIVGAARGAEAYLSEQFGEARRDEAHRVADDLLQRGKNVLENAQSTENSKEFIEVLEAVRAEVMLLRVVIAEEGSAGNVGAMEKMRDMRRADMSGAELLTDTELFKKVERVYCEHYESGEFPDGFADAILSRFRERLAEENSRFFALLYKNEPQAFLLASKNGNNCELSALNTNPEFEFIRAGLALVRCVMKDYLASGVSIVADCPPHMVQTYTKRFGFSVTGETEFGGQKLILLRKEAERREDGG